MEPEHQYVTINDPLDDEERELMNSDMWDWEHPLEVIVAENVGVQLPISITFEEFGLLERVARAEGLNSHTFMKQEALAAARQKDTVTAAAGEPRAATTRGTA